MKILEKLTPKKILIVLGIFASVGYIVAIHTPLPYADLFAIFAPNAAAMFLFRTWMIIDWYSLKNCGIPPFSPAAYSYNLYLCPVALALSILFLIALVKTKSKRNLWWVLAFLWTLLELLASFNELFTYFCFPLEIVR